MKKKWMAYCFALLLPLIAVAQPRVSVYKQATQPVEKRVADLLKHMTIEEKAAHLKTYLDLDAQHFNENASADSIVQRFAKYGLGLIQPLMVDITRLVAVRNAIQRYFTQQTRLVFLL